MFRPESDYPIPEPGMFPGLKPGDTVVINGSGSGMSCFQAGAEAGQTGRVIGVDSNAALISLARELAEADGHKNVSFRHGETENLPMRSNIADLVISDSMLNLVQNKDAALSDIYRILKPGGHFSLMEWVLAEDEAGVLPVAASVSQLQMPDNTAQITSTAAANLAGAVTQTEYLRLIAMNGFLKIQAEQLTTKSIVTSFLHNGKSDSEKSGETLTIKVYKIRISGEKPMEAACGLPRSLLNRGSFKPTV